VWNYNYQQPYACFGLGRTSTAIWNSSIDKISVKYTGGDDCFNTQPVSQYSLQIDFKCNPNSTASLVAMVSTGATQCDYVATFTTPLMVRLS
jgi:hypothetical protein